MNTILFIDIPPLWGKMPEAPREKIENMSVSSVSRMNVMVMIDNSSIFCDKSLHIQPTRN